MSKQAVFLEMENGFRYNKRLDDNFPHAMSIV